MRFTIPSMVLFLVLLPLGFDGAHALDANDFLNKAKKAMKEGSQKLSEEAKKIEQKMAEKKKAKETPAPEVPKTAGTVQSTVDPTVAAAAAPSTATTPDEVKAPATASAVSAQSKTASVSASVVASGEPLVDGLKKRPPIEKQSTPIGKATNLIPAKSVECNISDTEEVPYPRMFQDLVDGKDKIKAKKLKGRLLGKNEAPTNGIYLLPINGQSGYMEATYKNGKPEGEQKEYRQGYLVEMRVLNNQQLVTFFEYDRCSHVKTESHYLNGKLHGHNVSSFRSQFVTNDQNFKMGTNTGLARSWDTQTGQQTSELLYSESGEVISQKSWKDGILVREYQAGHLITRYQNGFIESESLATDKEFLGFRRLWHNNGRPMYHVDLNAQNQPIGEALRWDDKGGVITPAQWAKMEKSKENKQKLQEFGQNVKNLLMSPLYLMK